MHKKTVVAVVLGLVLAMPMLAQERRPMSFTERYGEQLGLTDTQKNVINDMEKKFDE